MILKKQNVKWMIIAYFTVCIILAWGLYEYFSTSELNSFLGSFVGGALGGLGTLLTLHFTVGSTYDIIAESRRNERKKFVDDIAEEIGQYITYVSDYRSTLLNLLVLHKKIKDIRAKISKLDKQIRDINNKLANTGRDNGFETMQSLIFTKEGLNEERDYEKEIYQETMYQIHEFMKKESANFINQVYYTLLNKLHGLPHADALIEQIISVHREIGIIETNEDALKNWLTTSAAELQKSFGQFAKEYVY